MATDVNLRYISLTDFIDEIPDQIQGLITDDVANSSTKDSSILEQKGVAAESIFESYVGTRYDLPVQASDGTTPPEVRQCIYVILKYLLYSRRNAVTPEIQAQYNDQINWLRAVSKGQATIAKIDTSGTIEDDGVSPTIEIGQSSGTNREFGGAMFRSRFV